MSGRSIWILALLALLPAGSPRAEPKLDFTAIVKDAEMLRRGEDRLTIVIWMPDEYWRAALESGGRLTAKAIDEFIKAVHPYTFVAVVDARIEAAGAFSYPDADELRTTVTVEDAAGNAYPPIAQDKLNAQVKNVMAVYKPLLANMMGNMGSHFELIVFPAVAKDGGRIAEAARDGSFTVHVSDAKFHYRLPLGSVLPPVVDDKTGEIFPGSYHFNPFTGNKLVPAPATSTAPAGPGK